MHFKYVVSNKNPFKTIYLEEELEEKGESVFVKKAMKLVRKFYSESLQKHEINRFEIKLGRLSTKVFQQFLKRLEKLYIDEKDKKSLEQLITKTFLEETTEANKYQNLLMKLKETQKKKNNLKVIFKKFAREVKSNKIFHTRPTANEDGLVQKFTCLYSNLTNLEHSCRPNTIMM